MSFTDVYQNGKNSGDRNRTHPSSSVLSAETNSSDIGQAVEKFQRSCGALREVLDDYKKKSVSPQEKQEFESQLNEIKKYESTIKSSLDSQMRTVESQPRSVETAQSRAKLTKLLRDFDRVRSVLQQIMNECHLIKTGTSTSYNQSSANNNNIIVQSSSNSKSFFQTNNNTQDLLLIPAIKGQDVDELLMEERSRDIMKLNQDLILVHEMMNDMAVIVKRQGEMVEEIATNAEASHEQAQAGLDQVKQAASYQTTYIFEILTH